ncbi:DUF4238 domain-containing protein [Stutzerimonas nitrititolerans]|uniref:DUF4238 domain-containing protein n=1 Tax=Stutzerimonas nitrititolerans TaxID=2482751 RepID=UPI00289DD733|nr:DUF4238 domain-containing protein [Stutzerimonas nitrititolerans]
MADKENQHFVPQYYFRFFSNDQKSISLLNKRTGKIVKTASIKGQASKSFFYGDADVENKVTEIESSFIADLRKTKREKSFECLSEEEVLSVIRAVLFQRSRTLAQRIDGKRQQDYLARLMAEVAINNNPQLSSSDRVDLLSMLDYVEADPIPFQGLGMALAIIQAEYLMDLKRLVIKNRTRYPFIFSDAPAVLINPMQQKVRSRGVLGMLTPGIIALLPLGPRLAIMFYDGNSYKVKGETKGVLNLRALADVDELNKLQMQSSAVSVYFNDYAFADYVLKLWSAVKKYLDDAPKGVIEESTLLDGEEQREFFHMYDRQLPVMPKFSFLSYEEVDAYSYLTDRNLWDGRNYY